MSRRALFLAIVLSGYTLVASAQAPPSDSAAGLDLTAAAQWPLERLELKGGRVYQGLVRKPAPGERAETVKFEIVGREPGRPMSLVVWSFDTQSISKLDYLPADERAKLIDRLEQFRNRAAQEALALSQLTLKNGQPGEAPWRYDGPWFRLESWTDKEMTGLTILRIEQVFAAYREILPPRTKPQLPLRIQLYGSTAEYAHFQKSLNYRFQNPAVYLPDLNLLAAGSELNEYAGRLAEVRKKHTEIRSQYDQITAAMPAALKKLSDDLEKSGVPPAERRSTRLAAERKWKQEVSDVYRRIDTVDRTNAAQFDVVTHEMLARLYHEAFHAYLENFVYPHDRFDVPRWMNEGLAQVFEEGLLELGSLRLDAPSRKRLTALQADLTASPPLSLAELLSADARAFLVSHSTDASTSQRHYLYSWGLAHYLAVREPILETARLDRYVDRANSQSTPVERFEQLVGMPLAQFEQKWREDMLALKGPEK